MQVILGNRLLPVLPVGSASEKMYKCGLVLALSGIVAACATSQTQTTQEKVCVPESEEATGSRVQTHTVCRPAEPNKGQ